MLLVLTATCAFVRLRPLQFHNPSIQNPRTLTHVHLRSEEARWSNETISSPGIQLSPLAQVALLLPAYASHTLFLSDISLGEIFGRLSPAIVADHALENLVGAAILVGCLPTIQRTRCKVRPWSKIETSKPVLVSTIGSLVAAYLLSGYVGPIVHQVFALGFGTCLSGGTQHALQVHKTRLSRAHKLRSLCAIREAWLHAACVQVLVGHLTWVWLGMRVLRTRLDPFLPPPINRGRWMSFRLRSFWLPWVLGGFFVSLLSYNMFDELSLLFLPPAELESPSILTPLINTQQPDILALSIGGIGPCVTAPIFEELLYRGFLLPALTRFFPLSVALPLHSALFGMHHNNFRGFLPLSILGLVWALLYVLSGNLVVPILVHAMWNFRIFFRSALLSPV